MFVAEAPAATGRHFYLANTNLYRETKAAFEQLLTDISTSEDFFNLFKTMGFYMTHLSLTQIDKSDKKNRNRDRSLAVKPFAERLTVYNPDMVMVMMKELVPYVTKAINEAGLDKKVKIVSVPYPAGSQTNANSFKSGLIRELKSFIADESLFN